MSLSCSKPFCGSPACNMESTLLSQPQPNPYHHHQASLGCLFLPVLTPLEPTGTSFPPWHTALSLRLFLLPECLSCSKDGEVTYVIT